ncbi:hypothetical protein C900_04586 [Fulvivirga imtechensis AK7]|uniref:Bacterial surface antigen (D15) domain-containing protein n=1 Tax=Fulvivirga imtechensis AK7 TaxID=1237149 RepID=L8JNX6_9BACT|nr:hypothetical protein C900_04586 [Fulvivirga imtechensis AK7]
MLTVSIGHGQIALKYAASDPTTRLIEKFQPLSQQVTDSLAALRMVNDLRARLYSEGYLATEIRSVSWRDSVVYIHVEAGSQYEWAALRKGNVPEVLLSKTGFRERFFIDKPFRYNELSKLFKRVIDLSENTGYPFASIKMDSIAIQGSHIQAILQYSGGPLITYDSLVIEGTDRVKSEWLASYLNIHYGGVFDQSTVSRIESRLEALTFVELTAPVQVAFQNSMASITLKLKNINANRVDGVIGFLPNAQNNGSLMVTGQFDLSLVNLFNSGKQLTVEWQRLKPLSQFLYISYQHPNLVRSPLHLRTSFELLKEDTTFINRTGLVAFNYRRSANEFSFFTRWKTSRLLSTKKFENTMTLPGISDFNINYYGVGYTNARFHDQRNKRVGMEIEVEAAVGSKKIRRNLALPAEVYEGLDLNSVQYQLEASYGYFIPVVRHVVFHQRIRGGKIINDQLFLNDLFRLGGLRSLRGFNENYFYASDYVLSNLELRLFYATDSWLFIFYDQSYLYFNTGESQFEDYPLGIGAGINFATKAGVVSLAYALGRSEEQPLSLRISKFHFGYVAKF